MPSFALKRWTWTWSNARRKAAERKTVKRETRRAPVDYKGPARPSAASLGDLLYVAATRARATCPVWDLPELYSWREPLFRRRLGRATRSEEKKKGKRERTSERTWSGMISTSTGSIARLYTSGLLCFFFAFGRLKSRLNAACGSYHRKRISDRSFAQLGKEGIEIRPMLSIKLLIHRSD